MVPLFNRQPSAPDPQIAQQVAALVNAGEPGAASALCDTTPNPRGTALLAFRWIDTDEDES